MNGTTIALTTITLTVTAMLFVAWNVAGLMFSRSASAVFAVIEGVMLVIALTTITKSPNLITGLAFALALLTTLIYSLISWAAGEN